MRIGRGACLALRAAATANPAIKNVGAAIQKTEILPDAPKTMVATNAVKSVIAARRRRTKASCREDIGSRCCQRHLIATSPSSRSPFST